MNPHSLAGPVSHIRRSTHAGEKRGATYTPNPHASPLDARSDIPTPPRVKDSQDERLRKEHVAANVSPHLRRGTAEDLRDTPDATHEHGDHLTRDRFHPFRQLSGDSVEMPECLQVQEIGCLSG